MERRSFFKAVVGSVIGIGAASAADTIPASSGDLGNATKLVVTAGDDTWEPSPEEMLAIQDMFKATLESPDPAVVVVRRGITVHGGDLREIRTLKVRSALATKS